VPYILPKTRERIANDPTSEIETPGELNYRITLLLKRYLAWHGPSYQTLNDILGALEGVKLEFYRRRAAPYEEQKMILNGDVYNDHKPSK
jgi:hypothetical protein